jgi:transcriptional regulator with GAF, ATPase, and Fis domain
MSLSEKEVTEINPDRLIEFKEYIRKLSTVFIAMPATKVTDEIDKRLKEIGEFWDFDHIHLLRLLHNEGKLIKIHSYTNPSAVPTPYEIETSKVPWLINVLHEGHPKAMSNLLAELPRNAGNDREVVKKLKIKSVVIVPFIVGGSVQGGLLFNKINHFCKYPEKLVQDLQHVGQILAGALERQINFKQIEHNMQFDRLLSEISATYINLNSEDTTRHIRRDLGRLGSLLNVDRCIFYLGGEKKGTYIVKTPFVWWPNEDGDRIQKVENWLKNNPDFIEDYNYCFEKWSQGEIVKFSSPDELPPEAKPLLRIHKIYGTRSWLSLPISVGGTIVGVLTIATIHEHRTWPEDLIPRLRLFGEVFANAVKRREHEESLKKAFREIQHLKSKIEADYVYLRDELTLEHNYEDIIGQSEAIRKVLHKVEQVAPTDFSVLIQGETGTGKELIARAIHYASQRKKRPLIKVNCATLPGNLIESELFGHEKGAFTGADKSRVGRFELADGASLFLDEIGELPKDLQPKLLRVLQEGEFERLGGNKTVRVDVRIIAATNRDLEKRVETGKFRSDLWYRLSSFPIFLPPLRERREDIPLLVNHFINKYAIQVGKKIKRIPQKAIHQLNSYSWPGNIRELDNIISRAIVVSNEDNLQVQLPESKRDTRFNKKTLKEMETIFITQTLEDCGWKIEGRMGAAETLGLKPSTLRSKMKKFNIIRP